MDYIEEELTVTTTYSVAFAVRVWRGARATPASDDAGNLRLLLLHGWLDNLASFSFFVPALLPRLPPNSSVAALDFAGHGRSGHSPSGVYSTVEFALHAAEVLDSLGWERCVVVGHSMGGGVAMVLAGSLPERVRGLVLLDSAGPPPTTAEAAPSAVAKFLAARAAAAAAAAARLCGARYPSAESAVAARLATVAAHPGKQSLSEVGAAALVARALQDAPGGGFNFRHDDRVKGFAFSFCEPQVHEFFRRVAAAGIPVALLRAASGWPYDRATVAARVALLGGLLTLVELPGSHHFHMDPETRDAVAAACAKWLHTAPLV